MASLKDIFSSFFKGIDKAATSVKNFFSSDNSSNMASIANDAIAGMNIPILSPWASAIASNSDKEEALQMYKEDKEWAAGQAQLNRIFQESERLQTQDFNLEMWNLSKDYNEEMWNKVNDYNSPANRVKLLQEAGLNPMAEFGANAIYSPTSPISSSPMSGATASHPGGIASTMLTSDAVVKDLMATSDLKQKQADNADYELTWNKLTEQERYNAIVNSNSESKARVDKILSDIGLNDIDKKTKEETFKWISRLSEEDWNIKKQQLVNLQAQEKLIRNQANTEQDRGNLLSEQYYEKLMQNDILQSTKDSIISRDLKELEADELEFRNMIEFSQIMEIPMNAPTYLLNFYLWKSGRLEEYYDNLKSNGLYELTNDAGDIIISGAKAISGSKTRKSTYNPTPSSVPRSTGPRPTKRVTTYYD